MQGRRPTRLRRLGLRSKAVAAIASASTDEGTAGLVGVTLPVRDASTTLHRQLSSRNDELTAINIQLQQTLDRQRTTAADLQNILYSTDVATVFLDMDLKIRFFTPATKALFNVIASDIGRPLANLNSFSADRALSDDALAVLSHLKPVDREIETEKGRWFMRRILPYKTDDDGVDGVVITFTDMSERRRAREALEAAKLLAERATIAKSRFLAAASHDLRQPLQTFALLQGLLATIVVGEKAQRLVARLDETLGSMTAMLDALLDINRIDAGTVRAELIDFPVNALLERMRDEYAMHAKAKRLSLHVVGCDARVRCDPRLLEQMLRNLLSNALKYTNRGKILLGCRRQGNTLRIEVWDTGTGIPAAELQDIFEEYYQLDNEARERSRGLGLGLSIVRRLAGLLDAPIHVRSQPGKGSVFTIALGISQPEGELSVCIPETHADPPPDVSGLDHAAEAILVVEDDPEVRDLLAQFLDGRGHRIATAPHGLAALELVNNGKANPELLLADYNLPDGLNGLQLAVKVRQQLKRHIPVIILTGDISTDTMREIARMDCVQLNKPVKLAELTQTIDRVMSAAKSMPESAAVTASVQPTRPDQPVIYVVDDDDQLRAAVRSVLEDDGRLVEDFSTCEAFLAADRRDVDACILVDAYLPGMSGLELLQRLRSAGQRAPAIMMTGDSDVPMAVQAMKAGACDFIEKPIGRSELLGCVERALEQARDGNAVVLWKADAAKHISGLTSRQREIMDLVLAGHPSKNIAADLAISQRTVENHRAAIMKKTGAKSLPALARLALAADPITSSTPIDSSRRGASGRPTKISE